MPIAYQDQDGKWFKQCSKTGQLFGPVDNKEDLSEWFFRHNRKSDGFKYECKSACNKTDYHKQYRKDNAEKIKHSRKQYSQSASGMYYTHKRRAERRNIDSTLTLEWFEEQLKLEEFNCCAISGIKFVDGLNHPFSRTLDRVDNSRGYSPDNVKWVCMRYNSWKSDLSPQEVNMIAEYANKNANQPLTV
jgi:hypothetical protein